MNISGLSIGVIGGGIGGHAAACALAQRGAQVTIYEKAPQITEVGAGLQVSANGQSVLRALGVVKDDPPLNALASSGTVMRDGARGRVVTRIPAPTAGPTWYMHRADLLDLLIRGCAAAGVKTELGQVARASDLAADIIIAADGARSQTREIVDGPTSPTFTKQVAWRAVIPCAGTVPDAASLSMGHRAHVVSYPLRGGHAMNLVCIEERSDWTRESWSEQGAASEFWQRFSAFGGAVGDLIQQVQTVHTWALFTRPVATRWYDERIVLLGDAAHPTLPFMAQGACLALEDAWVLADALTASDDIPSGFKLYQDVRLDRAGRVVGLAAGNAWRFHLPKPFAWGAQLALTAGAGILAKRLEWLYGYDATTAVTKAIQSA